MKKFQGPGGTHWDYDVRVSLFVRIMTPPVFPVTGSHPENKKDIV